MESFFLFIKHNFKFLWLIIDWANGILYYIFFSPRLNRVLKNTINEAIISGLIFRKIDYSDLLLLHEMISNQKINDLKYFNPHAFDMASLERQYKNPAFLMMGAFEGEKIVGYFFLRFFINKKCFVGRLIDKEYRGRGIGQVMNKIMYETAWKMGFRCLSTISRKNELVMKAHSGNPYMKVVKELDNDYLLVEFVREAEGGRREAGGNRK